MHHYIGTILEGRWKVIKSNRKYKYVLENIYNHNQMEISASQIKRVVEGKITIGKIQTYRISRKFTSSQRKQMKYRISAEQGYIK